MNTTNEQIRTEAQRAINTGYAIASKAPHGSLNERYTWSICAAALYTMRLAYKAEYTNTPSLSACLEENEPDASLRDFLQRKLSDVWDAHPYALCEFSDEVLKEAIMLLFSKVGDPSESPTFRDYATAKNLVNTVAMYLNIQPEDEVLDLGAGTGYFLSQISRREPHAHYHGEEINPDMVELAKIHASALEVGFSIEQIDLLDPTSSAPNRMGSKIFCEPPMGMRASAFRESEAYLKQHPYLIQAGAGCNAEWLFAICAMDRLIPNANSKAAIVMLGSCLFSQQNMPFRRYVVESRALESVVALPARSLNYTGCPPYLIILTPPTATRNTVRFIDLSGTDPRKTISEAENSDYPSRDIDIREIAAQSYDLIPAAYLSNKCEFKNPVQFGSVILEIKRGCIRNSDAKKLKTQEPTAYSFLQVSNISHCFIEEQNMDFLKPEEKAPSGVLATGDIVIGKVGIPLKAAVVENKEGQFLVPSENLFSITLNTEQADPYYVLSFLCSAKGRSVINATARGTVMPCLSIEGLKKMAIDLPPMEEQQSIAQTFKKHLRDVRIAKMCMEKAVADLDNFLNGEEE